MGRNTALHTAPQAINSAGSSLAKIFASGPGYYQKGQQMALMQALQNQQIASGAATQKLNDNKAAASDAIDAYIESIGGDDKIYQRDASGNVLMSNDGKPMIRQDVGARMIRAGLKADPNWNPAVVLGMMGTGKPLEPVHVPADGGKTLHSPGDNRFGGSGAAHAAAAGVTPAMVNNADPALPAPDLSRDPTSGVIPGAGAAPAVAAAVPFDSPIANAATAGLNDGTTYQNPAAAPKSGSKVISDLAEVDAGMKDVEAARVAAEADKGAFNWKQHFPSEIYQKMIAGSPNENADTASKVANAAAAYRLAHSGKATTAAEEARNQQVIPHMYDRQPDVITKLKTINDALTNKRSSLVDAMHLGGDPAQVPAATPTPSPTPSPTPFQVKTEDDFHALAPGTQFTTPDGRVLIKQ